MGNRIGRKRLERIIKRMNATQLAAVDAVGSRSGLNAFDMPAFELQPAKYFGFFDDFVSADGNRGVAVDSNMAQASAVNQGAWRTLIGGASDAIALDNAQAGGVVTITGGTDDDDVSGMQAPNTGFVLDASDGRKLWWEARIRVSTAAEVGFFAGLASSSDGAEGSVEDDPITSLDDGIGFYLLDGQASTTLQSLAAVGDTETRTDTSTTVANNTWIICSMYWDGTTVSYYVNGVFSHSSATNIPNDGTVIWPNIQFIQQTTNADTLSIDYIRVCQER